MRSARLTTRLRQVPSSTTATRNGSTLYPRPQALQRQPQPTVSSDDGHSSRRLRQHGNKSLPLPPLLDPKRIAAHERHTVRKQDASEQEQTDFQKQLAANPFANALATPIRQCHHTRVRLPSHFLQPFTAHISPNSPEQATIDQKSRPNRPITVSLLPCSRQDLPSNASSLPASTYVLNTRSTIEHLGKKRRWGRIVGPRMQEQYARRLGKKDAKNVDVGREWVWDERMGDTVLGQLRREVVKQSEKVLGGADDEGERDDIVPLEVARGERCIAVLMRGGISSTELPKAYADMLKGVPVYPLEDMLGAEVFESVSHRLRFDEQGAWAVAATQDRGTLPLLSALHRLAMYLELDTTADIQKSNGKMS